MIDVEIVQQVVGVVEVRSPAELIVETNVVRFDVVEVNRQGPPGPPGTGGELDPDFVLDGGNF